MQLPTGLETRHMAAGVGTVHTVATPVVVSATDGTVCAFRTGYAKLVSVLVPFSKSCPIYRLAMP